jgi:hypothetical protein
MVIPCDMMIRFTCTGLAAPSFAWVSLAAVVSKPFWALQMRNT